MLSRRIPCFRHARLSHLQGEQGIPFHWVFVAFGLFIVTCGFTHFMEVWVIWTPVYGLSGYVKVITALASVATAIALFPLLPKVFRLVAATRASEERRAKIEELNQELERFNYSIAHDLRAPLRGIQGFADALRQDYGHSAPEDAQLYIERIGKSAERMDALISGLLHYAKISNLELNLNAVPLSEPISAAIGLLESEIAVRRAEVIVREPLAAVRGDPTLLQVIFQNLIGNALKFVGSGVRPRVEISAQSTGSEVIVRVSDNGTGIPEDQRERVFDMFLRLHPNEPGTGVGLPLVRRAVNRLGGRMGIASAANGTEIWIRLQAAEPGAALVGAGPGPLRFGHADDS